MTAILDSGARKKWKHIHISLRKSKREKKYISHLGNSAVKETPYKVDDQMKKAVS